MAGGSGTRFWPLSRKQKPKQILNIVGRTPMVVETCDRLSPVSRDEELILIIGQDHLSDTTNLFSGRSVHIVTEPVGRNTAPCMGLGALYARYQGCREPVAFLPADHYIGNPPVFIKALKAAGTLAESGGIVTLGIVPSRPETGYGYIRRNPSIHLEVNGLSAYRVSEFVEKPNMEKALNYLQSGDYYWNAGIFVATPDTILCEIKTWLPDLHEGLLRLEKVLGTEQFETELRSVYEGLKGVSFDYGIMERTQAAVHIIPCDCGWSDVGSWASLYELKSADHDPNKNLIDGQAHLIDCAGTFVSARGKRLVACLGIKNLLVVDTDEILLVTDLNCCQDIRKIVEELRNTGKEEHL